MSQPPTSHHAPAAEWRERLRRDGADRARWQAMATLAARLPTFLDTSRALDAVLQAAFELTGARDGAVLVQRGARWQVLAGAGRALPPGASAPPAGDAGPTWLLGPMPPGLRTVEAALPLPVATGLLAVAVAGSIPEEDIEALHVLAAMAAGFAIEPARAARRPRRADPRLARLTPRERQVLALLPRGLSNAALGSELGIAPGTVKVHVERILQKLAVGDRTQAAVYAAQHGLSA